LDQVTQPKFCATAYSSAQSINAEMCGSPCAQIHVEGLVPCEHFSDVELTR